MSTQNSSSSSRTGYVSGAFVLALAALIIGCGGGGGGSSTTSSTGRTATGSTSTGTTSTGTTSTGTTSTGTTSTGTTSTGTTSGVLAPNTILYSTTPDFGTTINLIQIDSKGNNSKQLASFPSANYSAVGLNPAVSGIKVFSYTTGTGATPLYGIYQGGSVNIKGAAPIVAPTYTFISQIQVSVDGAYVYYTAAAGSAGNFELYKVSINGGAPIVLDSANIYTFNVDSFNGSRVTYDKNYTYLNGNSKSAVFIRTTAASGNPVSITNDPSSDYSRPQFSKDATQIVLVSNKDDAQYDVYTMSASATSTNGSGLTRVTNSPTISKYFGATLSADGTQAAFIGLDNTGGTASGVFVSGAIGTSGATTQIVTDAGVQPGIYWTSAAGRSRGGTTGFFGARRPGIRR